MNFSPFVTQFGSLQANSVNQFATAKFVQNITNANGQVMGLVSGADGGVHYLRPIESETQFTTQASQNIPSALQQTQGYITLPITMPGAKPGDAQQTVHIQILNPNPPIQQQQKFQMGQMQIPLSNFHQDTTVLTVAYAPQEGEVLQNHNLNDAMTIVAAIQPQDLPLLAQVQQQQITPTTSSSFIQHENVSGKLNNAIEEGIITNIKQEPVTQNTVTTQTTSTDLNEYFSRIPQSLPINLQQFLKFNSDITVKQESQSDENSSSTSGLNLHEPQITITTESVQTQIPTEESCKIKRKRKYKQKPPKPKKPKPGQVIIATALDGTALYCCPECHMAYPEKENLEQHLTVHKIERRFICDICGAGLKRKEHLERHKSGHNPDRPYTCSVCMKGFKRKEHLNLHFVIHSGAKTEICTECGKGFYRKDHLRKHAKSHALKRLKEEMANAAAKINNNSISAININTEQQQTSQKSNVNFPKEENKKKSNNFPVIKSVQTINSVEIENKEAIINQMKQQSTTICLPEVTIHVPTSDNQILPVQIQLPQLVTTNSADGSANTVVLSPTQLSSTMYQSSLSTQDEILGP